MYGGKQTSNRSAQMMGDENIYACANFPAFSRPDMPDKIMFSPKVSNRHQQQRPNQQNESMQSVHPKPPLAVSTQRSTNSARNPLTELEFEHFQARVIALENILIGLLSGSSDHQITLVREIAMQLLPQTGHTQHVSTQTAANQLAQLLERADHFRRLRGE